MSLIIDATYRCYQAMGFKPNGNSLDHLVLGFGKKVNSPFLSVVEYTELYLYEEFIFSINLAREADGLNQFMRKIIKYTTSESHYDETVSPQEVQGMMITLGYEVIEILLEQVCIRPVHDNSWFIDFANARLHAYDPLLMASYHCIDPLPERKNFSFGFPTREHPLFIYLGAVSDNFADALNIDHEYPLLQLMVLNRYTRFHETAKMIGDSIEI